MWGQAGGKDVAEDQLAPAADAGNRSSEEGCCPWPPGDHCDFFPDCCGGRRQFAVAGGEPPGKGRGYRCSLLQGEVENRRRE